jgi:hypothetical protein
MFRFSIAGVAMLVLTNAVAAEEDNGPALVDLFVKTCGRRSHLPSEIERGASRLGFVSANEAISPDMERGPGIDILYSARLTQRNMDVGMTAYFAGPIDGPTVVCTLNTVGVSADALPALIEKSLNARDRTARSTGNDNRLAANWRVGDGETLEMSVWRTPPQRASISMTYRGQKR